MINKIMIQLESVTYWNTFLFTHQAVNLPDEIKGWTILTNSQNLKADKKSARNTILEEHNDLAICYAMKEEIFFTLVRYISLPAKYLVLPKKT